jgi:hypothetical protein
MRIWQGTIQDEFGNAVPNAAITVRRSIDNSLAELFDIDGDPISNPFETGLKGFAQFAAEPNEYTIQATLGGGESKEWTWQADYQGDVPATFFGVVVTPHGDPEPSQADAIANATALQNAIDATAASGDTLLLPEGVIWVAKYIIRKTDSIVKGVPRAGGSVIKMHGSVHRNMPLCISSTRNVPQKNINWSDITFDFTQSRKDGDAQEAEYGAGNIITFTTEEREAAFGLATNSLLGTCFQVADANDDDVWSEYRRIIALDGERHSIDVSAPSDFRGSSPAALGLPTGTATTYDPNPARYVRMIDCEGVGAGDDCITTHQCSHVMLIRCIGRDARGERVGGNANAIEIDDATRNCWVIDCYGIGADNALQIKGHNDAPAPYNIWVENFVGINCRHGFELRHTGFYGSGIDPDEPEETVDEFGNPFGLTGVSATARNVYVNGCHIIAPRETIMGRNNIQTRSAQQAFRIRSYENVQLKGLTFSDGLTDLAISQDGYLPRTTSSQPIMQINGGASRITVDGFTSRGGSERPSLIRIFGTAGSGIKLNNILATDAPRRGIHVTGNPGSRVDLGAYDIVGDWLSDSGSTGVQFSGNNSGPLGYGRVIGYSNEVVWPTAGTTRLADGEGIRGDLHVTRSIKSPTIVGTDSIQGPTQESSGTYYAGEYIGQPSALENEILVLCKADTPGTVFRGEIRSNRSVNVTTAHSSAYSAVLDYVVSSNGEARANFDLKTSTSLIRFRIVQFRMDGVEYIGLQNISGATGAELRLGHLRFTGTRTEEPLAFTVVTLADLDEYDGNPTGPFYGTLSSGDPTVDDFGKNDRWQGALNRWTFNGAEVLTEASAIVLPGPFADDAAAATGGVSVNAAYRETGGAVKWRQT